jgi:hypothetical protein
MKGPTATMRMILALVPLLALSACSSPYDPAENADRPAPYSSAAICYHKQGPAAMCSDDLHFTGVLPANAAKECTARYESVGAAPLAVAAHLYSTSSTPGRAEAAAWLKQQRTALGCDGELTLK